MTCPTSCNHPRVTLVDGTETCTWSNAWRLECEARYVARLPHLKDRRDYLDRVPKKRSLELRSAIEKIWSAARAGPAGGGP